ncbi:aminopeptidase P family protein [Mesorhizobium sp. M7A.F.Ca.US.014.04.1.1]|uniref:M24 family metallopeptidase n=1 Tax=Mesorhizobium TaxID=68287 RepID=UPI0007A9597D|nr:MULTISPECIES: M24 family metallopeptidase [Mesorhizobium]AMX97555.1 hypothetical protein A4R28_30450 [Mesorhizobium ciceri]MDF3233623.1 M24 family metallopeptidase [Mesorhizobium sp. DSM 30133]RUU16153.1 aminopeptidase P family protein [Mesorhizobium sp. Primo-B]RUU34142.1 aminopeptidase P family protein [Mesorhizobium sp. Primo-A]RUX46428.1 aminopeptidase P family protein [Mesorhizobium sp. M7A.F.Ca.US.014.04.1.1]
MMFTGSEGQALIAFCRGLGLGLLKVCRCRGKWSARQNEIYDGAIAGIEAGVAACRLGVTASDLYKAVLDVLDGRGIFCGYPIYGHSFGLGWGGPWLVPDNSFKVGAGMAIAVECMAGREDVGYVKFEHNCLS